MTDEAHLGHASQMFGRIELERATKGPAVVERTAATVWKVLSVLNRPVVLWNVFPLHPHEAEDPMSNRCHTRIERQATMPLFSALLKLLRPQEVVAIGRDAAEALANISPIVVSVRHPSYGGQSDFVAGLYNLYNVRPDLSLVKPRRY
jgi:uracil-DNA glycosylase